MSESVDMKSLTLWSCENDQVRTVHTWASSGYLLITEVKTLKTYLHKKIQIGKNQGSEVTR